MSPARLTIAALVVAAVLCLAGGLVAAGLAARFSLTAERAPGTVVRNVLDRDRSGDPQRSDSTFKPLVTFIARDGREVRFLSERGGSPPRYRPGERVEVLYAPGDPQDARLEGASGLWSLPLLLPAIGATLLGTALLLRMVTRESAAPTG